MNRLRCAVGRLQTTPELLSRAFTAVGEIPQHPAILERRTHPGRTRVMRRHPETEERRPDALRLGLVPHFTKHLIGHI